MTPTIRIDDEVMRKIEQEAVAFGLVFGTPNAVLRAILKLSNTATDSGERDTVQIKEGDAVEIHMPNIHTPRTWALIPLSRDKRGFFPGYKVYFELETDLGAVTTRVTSAPKGTPVGDPKAGGYIQGGLRSWYDGHPGVQDGARVRIEAIEPGKRYKLSIAQSREGSVE